MVITSKFLKKPLVIEKLNLLALAPATLIPPEPTINLEPITDLVDSVTTVGEIGLKGLELLGSLAEYITDPAKLLIDLWNVIHYISYPVLLSLALFAIFMYMIGHKNFAKYIPTSMIIFTFIQAIGRF